MTQYGQFTLDEHRKRITRCRSCDADIIWLKMVGKDGIKRPHPTDASSVTPDDGEDFIWTKHKSHFSTCPNAALHRRRK